MAGIKDFKQFFLEKPTEEMRQTETDPTNFTTTPNLTSPNTQMVSQNFTPNQTGWSLYPNGSAQFEALHIKDVLKTVPADGDIQGAIDIISASGGGTVQLSAGTYKLNSDIIGYSNVSIKGAGVGSTVLDFQSGNYGLKYAGNTTTGGYIENFAITDLTVKDADLTGDQIVGSRTGGIHIYYAKFFEVRNVVSTGCNENGLKIEAAEDFSVTNCNFDNNGIQGLEVLGADTYNTKRFTLQNCFADSNGQDGINITGLDARYTKWGSVINCHAEGNTQNGIWVFSGEAIAVIGCSATSNGLHGFSTSSGSCNYVGCMAESNTTDGFYLGGGANTCTGCQGRYSGNLNFNIDFGTSGARTALAGNVLDRLASSNPNNALKVYDSHGVSQGNAAQSAISYQNATVAWNNTGSTINAGEVVTRKATADGYQIETTTIQGDPNVLGMALFDINTNSTSEILVEGKTTILKVNGEEDISVGDWLQTSTVAGVAMRASTAGQTVFAKALTAYATGATGTLTALLVYPRSI